MIFRILIKGENLHTLMRRIGYKPIGMTDKGEMNCVRPISGPYPRFHAYVKEQGGEFIVSLHLDQKRPSYEGHTAHSGDYDSEIVREEADRIKGLV